MLPSLSTAARMHGCRLAIPAALIALLAACDGAESTPDAGAAPEWEPDCVEVGPPGETTFRAVCRDDDVIAAFCEVDGGIVICPASPMESGVDVAPPRCERTATVVCNEGSPSGPRLEEPMCLDDSPPSCAL